MGEEVADSGFSQLRRDHCFSLFSSLKNLEQVVEQFLLLRCVWFDQVCCRLCFWAYFLPVCCGPSVRQGLHFSCVYGSHWSTFSGIPSWRNPPRLGFVLSGCHFARLIDTRGSLSGPGTSPEQLQLISVWQDWVATRCRNLAGTTMEWARKGYWYGALDFFLPTVQLKKKHRKSNLKRGPECEVPI